MYLIIYKTEGFTNPETKILEELPSLALAHERFLDTFETLARSRRSLGYRDVVQDINLQKGLAYIQASVDDNLMTEYLYCVKLPEKVAA